MSSTFVRSRNRGRELLYTAERPAEGISPWLVTVGIGTAGSRRALLLLQRISELSALGRVQSAVFYDCNEITAAYVGKFLRKFLGGARTGSGIQVLLPNYIPLPNGFMRDPRRYEEYLGPLERDMDNIVSQLTAQSERCGRAPELIVEFMALPAMRRWGAFAPEAAGGFSVGRDPAGDDAAAGSCVRGMDAAVHLGGIRGAAGGLQLPGNDAVGRIRGGG